jgi:hypothetical protein
MVGHTTTGQQNNTDVVGVQRRVADLPLFFKRNK